MSTESFSVTIRPARDSDAGALGRLATLDSAAVPTAPVLVAEVEGELVAALGAMSGEAVADPFRPTAEALELLGIRARRLRQAPTRRRLAARRRGSRATTPRVA